MKVEVRNSVGNSKITFSLNNTTRKNVVQLLSNGKTTVPQLYALDNRNNKNAYQYITGEEGEVVPLGIVCQAKGAYSLSFADAANLSVNSLVLRDKELNIEQDLFENNVYDFENISGNLTERFELVFGPRYIHTGIEENVKIETANIYVSNNTLYIESNHKLLEIRLFNMHGLEMLSDSNMNDTFYSKSLNVPAGVYIAKIKLANGESKIKKIYVPL